MTIEQLDTEQSIKELDQAKDVKITIELSAWEAYSLIVAVQLFKATNSKLAKIAMVGELAARRLHERLGNSYPATYRLLSNGWFLK